jgi:uncharacterized protein (TIGR02246 family)
MSGEQQNTNPAADLEAVVRDYLKAFESRDLEGCLGFFNEDASLNFQGGVYRGLKGIGDWHRDRFAADLKVLRIESIHVDGERVVVDAVVTSKRLTAWRLTSVPGRITVQFNQGKIQEGKFAPRMMSPIDMIRST